MKSTDISLDRQASSASVIRFEKLSREHQLSWRKLLKIIILNFILYIIQVYCTLIYKYEQVAIRRRKCPTIQQKNEWTQKWPYEKDALPRESTLCVAGALIGRLWQIQNVYHWPQSKLERKSKTEKREFLDPRVTKITPGRHKQKGLNLLFLKFLTSAWSLASW